MRSAHSDIEVRLMQQAEEEDESVQEDVDVAEERRRVMSRGAASDSLCLRNLRKVYDGSPPKARPHAAISSPACIMR